MMSGRELKFTFWLLSVLCLMSACSDQNAISNLAQEANSVEFSYYYHGFLIESTDNQNQIAPNGTYIIDTQEEYDEFFSTYDLSSIYQLDTVDFNKECLIYYGLQGAQSSRGWSTKIQSIQISDTQLELVQDETVNFGGENEDATVAYQIIGSDCAVREVFFLKVQKENLPESLRDIYQPEYNQ